jgi:lysophospholipase L1-like esterase
MATIVKDEFGSRANPPDSAYPLGSLKDETNPGSSNDGSPLSSRVGNDFQGFMQSALEQAGINANGNPDSVENPQILNALKSITGGLTNYQADSVANRQAGITIDGSSVPLNSNQVWSGIDTSENINNYTPAMGEIWVSTTDNTIHIGDGSTLGGVKQATSLDAVPIRGKASGNLFYSISRGSRADVILIGDSITEGVGASVWSNRYANMFEKSLNGNVPDGFGYGLNVNMFNALEEPNISTTGQLIAGSTTTGSVLRLDDGEYILMSQYQLDFVDVIYDGTLSSGSMDILIDDTVVASETLLTTSDTLTTFPTPITRTDKSNAIKIQANGGTIIVKSIVPLRKAFNAPILHRYGKSGWGYQDFNLQSSVDEINKITTLLGSASQVVVLALGTNNIYNSSKSLTPNDTVAEARSLISKIKATLSNPHFVVAIPPKANEGMWPVIESGFSYEDYKTAMLGMIEDDGHQAFRADLIGLLDRGLYSDGLHPDDSGHILYAHRLCYDLAMPYMPYRDDINQSDKYVELPIDCTYNSTWGDFGADPAKRLQAVQIKNQVFLSGIVQPNGSASTAVGNIPLGIDPPGQRDVFTITRDDGGVALVSISVGGQIQVNSVPSSWISFDNISYTVR